ncbi:Las1-domain-containing protein [Dichomitus squalens LYAD-421 SS1]|uniref:Las1-domain-containing protein n=1 Tax=Dichomitus squalens (strain LYAD-421) TaxID=732165 RepID=R7SQD6_DICSQ|nr:Las1-domain-containing protein [Dichomitus squalens LYAD-421 SS1]EJF58409.1 Las1-domain-containing protein [Dichomitus squalens LYAD-421 SS1]
MRLPRRVPWESIAELEQVCSWIFADEADLNAKQRAIDRLAAWKAAVHLPHALDSTHAILSVILQDGTAATSSSYLSLRMSYASAIIRLVNGLVDPLQLGAYARSIHSIAQQLGLPAWFVELRHAATHEDLPSLEVLRDAAKQAMAWLLDNYFLPTLNPVTPSSGAAPPLRPLSSPLKQYKAIMKATTRDATLHVEYRAEITKVMRDIERWIAEAKVASASAAGGVRWEDGQEDGDEEDVREKWALDRLAEVLVDRGMLVPLSKKKRISPDQGSLALPRSSIAIWSPLLTHLQSLHPTLPLHLVNAITSHLSRAHTPPCDADFGAETVSLAVAAQDPKDDPTYDLCLASWAKWLADNCPTYVADPEDAAELRESIIVRIVSTLSPARVDGSTSKAANALLRSVSAERPRLAAALSVLTQMPAQASQDWDDNIVNVMDTRLNTLLALSNGSTEDETGSPGASIAFAESTQLPPGWRRLTERDGWRPAPIGIYVACA